jgi:CBS domain-containing protein
MWVGAVNVFLAVFNLLPGAPLDGGRILKALIWMRSGDRARASRVATSVGQVLGGGIIVVGLAEVLILRQASGLWLMLVGWFLLWASAMEGRSGLLREATVDLRVGDLMLREPDCAPAWHPVSEFVTAVAAHSRQSVFPVIGVDGEPLGIVTLRQLSQIPPAHAGDRVDSLATPLPGDYRRAPDDPASSLLDRPPLAGVLLAVVVAHGSVVGMVTTDDLGRLVQQRRMRRRLSSSPAD